MIRFAEKLKVLPVLGPISTTSAGTEFIDLDMVQWLTFMVTLGAMTSDSTDTINVTVECSTAVTTSATDIQLPFHYRLSAAVATDTMGAISTADSTGGATVTAEDDNKVLIIDVDPACVPSQTSYTNHRFCRLFFTMSTELATNITGAIAVIEPRYPGNAIPSST